MMPIAALIDRSSAAITGTGQRLRALRIVAAGFAAVLLLTWAYVRSDAVSNREHQSYIANLHSLRDVDARIYCPKTPCRRRPNTSLIFLLNLHRRDDTVSHNSRFSNGSGNPHAAHDMGETHSALSRRLFTSSDAMWRRCAAHCATAACRQP